MSGSSLDTPYWSQSATELMAALGSGPGGLSTEKAIATLRAVGPNTVEESSHLSAFRLFPRQFESPLVLILIFAAGISLVLQQWVDSTIILAIVLARKYPARILSGVPRVNSGRGTETPFGADMPCHTGQRRTRCARQHNRARRYHPAVGR